MTTLLAAVSAAAFGFVAGCLWEACRADGSIDKADALFDALRNRDAAGFSSSFPAAPPPPGTQEPGGTNLLNDPVDCEHIERIERAKGDE